MAKGDSDFCCYSKENPSFFFHFLPYSPFSSPRRNSRNPSPCLVSFLLPCSSVLCFIVLCVLLTTSEIPILCSLSSHSSSTLLDSLSSLLNDQTKTSFPTLSAATDFVALPLRVASTGLNDSTQQDFWSQPDNEGYRPCLDFSLEYRKKSTKIAREKRKFLVVVTSGGLNQQRNQIVDAVVIARILEAALVVPVLQVNPIWGDESEFSEIFDLEHFKISLQDDVRIVSSLPSTHLVPRQRIDARIPLHVSPSWIKSRFLHKLNKEGLLILKGLDSRLSKNLPSDLQKLRCKVAFHALRFTPQILTLGNMIARRMWIEGPYIALHLRLEKDVWVRTGCPTGLGPEYDKIIAVDRNSGSSDALITKVDNTSQSERRIAGLCPLNAFEVARFLKALGAPKDAHVYIAGGEAFGGAKKALEPLVNEFPNISSKENLSREGELTLYKNKASVLAAVDYIVSLSSNVFMASHGGNMAKAMQGHRAYIGHRKYITVNKRKVIHFLGNDSVSEEEFTDAVRKFHKFSKGQPELRSKKLDRDVLAFPVPECMCKR